MKDHYTLTLKPLFLFAILILFVAGETRAQVSYAGKPRYQIVTKRAGQPLGTIIVELFPNIAPRHAYMFDSLVSTKFYDTTAFHRVIPGFMIQGGDPNSRHGPISSWGYGQTTQPRVKAEFSAAKHVRGIMSAARSSDINSATSQFFICVATASQLDGLYSIYGRVCSGMDVVDTIVLSPRNMTTNNPLQKIEMFVTYIGLNDTVPQPPVLISPATGTVGVDTNVVTLKWNKVSDAQFYRLTVSTDSLFTDTVKSLDLAALSSNVLFLQPGQKYWWKVRANNGGFYKESDIWNFTTTKTEINSTNIKVISPATQSPVVFPNPGTGKFNFANLTAGYRIEILDLAGKVIKEVLVSAPLMEIELPLLAKGEYVYRVSDGNNKEVIRGKIILQQ